MALRFQKVEIKKDHILILIGWNFDIYTCVLDIWLDISRSRQERTIFDFVPSVRVLHELLSP